MSKKALIQAIGWLLVLLALSIIIFRRIAGIDLAEGQLLIQDWPWWVTAIACGALGAWLANR